MSNPNPFDELRDKLSDVETRTAARLIALAEENDRLVKENRELWSTVHEYQDAASAAALAGGDDRQG